MAKENVALWNAVLRYGREPNFSRKFILKTQCQIWSNFVDCFFQRAINRQLIRFMGLDDVLSSWISIVYGL